MQAIIKCATCAAVLVTVNKEVISDSDCAEYMQMSSCEVHAGSPEVYVDGVKYE